MMDQKEAQGLYLAARENPIVAKSLDDAKTIVAQTNKPTLVVLPSNTLGREDAQEALALFNSSIEKGVVIHFDEADFIETKAERRERLIAMFKDGLKHN